MFKSRPISFRRILLSRILLLLVPVLLSGVYVTYRKARSSLLDNARQSVIESAIREGERLKDTIAALEANLITASTATVWQDRSPQTSQEFLLQLQQKLPTNIQCIQLTNFSRQSSQGVRASTCGNQPLANIPNGFWSLQQEAGFLPEQKIYVTLPDQAAINKAQINAQVNSQVNSRSNPKAIKESRQQPPAIPENPQLNSQLNSQSNSASSPQPVAAPVSKLHLIFSVPIYDRSGNLSQVLHVETSLLKEDTPSTVIINEDGLILAHPLPNLIGAKIQDQPDVDRLKNSMRNALQGRQGFLHLFSFQEPGQELLSGYNAIPSPVTSPNQQPQQLIILSLKPLDQALAGLSDIQQILLVFTLALLMAGIFAAMYISSALARPIEQIRDYALHCHPQAKQPTQDFQGFQIREFVQLSQALQNMVTRLTTWAGELEMAWQEATAANRLKSEFLATTSHELRTPLNAIIGCLRLVQDGFCDDREEELDMLQKADQAAVRLLEIIDDLLAFAKIESGSLAVQIAPLNLTQLLKDVIQLQLPSLESKGLALARHNLDQQINIRGDEDKVQQVFLNILSNAIKFTDQGGISISLYLESSRSQNSLTSLDRRPANSSQSLNTGDRNVPNQSISTQDLPDQNILTQDPPPQDLITQDMVVVVEIKDTGVGIPLHDQSKLFHPFVMADGSSTRRFGGTGLGLAISRNLVEMMGGSIRLFSAGEGRGTTVQIVLPTLQPPLATINSPIELGQS
jgi:two-component system sensor histidine kinase BarA